jgi:hypothetical protein
MLTFWKRGQFRGAARSNESVSFTADDPTSPHPDAESAQEQKNETGAKEVDVVNGEYPARCEQPNDSGIEHGEETQTEETCCD